MLAVSTREKQTNVRRQGPSFATWSLIGLSVTIYLIQAIADEHRYSEFILRFGLTPEIFLGSDRPYGGFPTILTPLTSMFLHGSLDHLLINMLYLWIFGEGIEEALGSLRFVLFYLLCGICGGLGYVLADGGTTLPLIGATGSVSGVIVAYLMLKPCDGITLTLPGGSWHVASYWAVGSWLLVQLFQYLWHAEEGFSTLAQPGGAIVGAIAFWLMCPRGTKLFECRHPSDFEGTHI